LEGLDVRLYDLRHLAASTMLAGGAPLPAVADQLGHRSPVTTAKIYSHIIGDAQRRAAKILPELKWDHKGPQIKKGR